MGISSPEFKRRKKDPPHPSTLPNNYALTTTCSQQETATSSNSCSSPINFYPKQPYPISPYNLLKADFPVVSLDLPIIHHSLPVWICNSLFFLNFADKITGYFICEVDRWNAWKAMLLSQSSIPFFVKLTVSFCLINHGSVPGHLAPFNSKSSHFEYFEFIKKESWGFHLHTI